MVVFSGQHEHGVDPAGRVIIPVMYRDALVEGAFLTRGMDECIWLFPAATWRTLSSRMRQGPSFSRASRLVDRRLFSGTETTVDKQGRLMIPPHLRQHAGLAEGEPVVIAGVKNRIELWHPDRWQEALAADEAALDQAMAELDL